MRQLLGAAAFPGSNATRRRRYGAAAFRAPRQSRNVIRLTRR